MKRLHKAGCINSHHFLGILLLKDNAVSFSKQEALLGRPNIYTSSGSDNKKILLKPLTAFSGDLKKKKNICSLSFIQ